MRKLVTIPEKCSGCDICTLACSSKKFGAYNPSKALLRVETQVPIVCNQCGDCFRACRFGAISESELGYYFIDKEKCTGCGECESACKKSVLKMVQGKAYKCDLCGLSPKCVQYCLLGALQDTVPKW